MDFSERRYITTTLVTGLWCCLALLGVPAVVSAQDAGSPSKSPAVAPADSNPERKRPRIGLVLGGGGARGAAHIGVLKELERMRVPVDAIAGTSMGAIVGGLFASGMTPTELEELVGNLDWAAALNDKPAREDLSFRRKQDDDQFPISFELGYRDGELRLPKGVIQGQNLDFVLQALTANVTHIDDFDELPIPFRAIASDIERGEPYVMDGGNLATSVRASMSVPGVFSPVVIDERLLVDGGIVGNLPVSVMQEMDVDVIIAVDVEFPLYPRDELTSALTITEQMLTVLIRKETLRQIDRLSASDVLIQPDLGTFASTNFAEITGAIQPGSQATHAKSSQLAALAVDAESYASYLAGREVLRRAPETIDFVRVVQDSRVSPSVLESRMALRPGDGADPERLAHEANRLYGLQLFEKVGYRLIEEDGLTGVEFNATSKSWGPNYLKFGVVLEDDFEGSTGFNLTTRLWRPAINELGAEWRTDLRLGTDPSLFTEFYQPLRFDSRVFVAPRLQVGQTNINAFLVDETIARLRLTEAQVGLDIGAEIGTIAEFRAGVFRGLGEARVKVGDPSLPNVDFDTGGVFAGFSLDTFDSAEFPRRGSRVNLRWTLSRPGLGADQRFETYDVGVGSAWSRGKSTFLLALAYHTTRNGQAPVQDLFPLGGFLRLSGLERGQISGPHAGLARLLYYRRIGSSAGGLFDVPTYAGASIEAGNVWQTRGAIDSGTLLKHGSLFLGFDTIIGPVYLAAGIAEGGRSNFYLFIGQTPQ